jgi:hypothetical protein
VMYDLLVVPAPTAWLEVAYAAGLFAASLVGASVGWRAATVTPDRVIAKPGASAT